MFAYSWALIPPTMDLRLVLIVLRAVFSELFPFAFPVYTISLAYPLSMSAAVLGGPASACIVSFVTTVNIQDIRDRRPFVLGCSTQVSCLSPPQPARGHTT